MKRLVTASLTVIGLTIAGPAFAGGTANAQVNVIAASRQAYGAIGTARNSADTTQYLGCYLFAAAGGDAIVTCTARSAAGAVGTCSSKDPKIVAVGQSINSDSYVMFGWDASGGCTYLNIYEISIYPPKAH